MRDNLKFLREARGWSLTELSDISGISKKILTGMEAEEDFEVNYMLELCRVYQIKPHKLFSRIDLH
ncbi:MAG: helix-turn-helix domain-containing protein [Oscillospiraceae bacterium]|nr:helix-turn-helix domain-containing protein [Oscillospiraceae bacterium]